MILLVRHALAVPRSDWDKDDAHRPLTQRGSRQALGLATTLRSFPVERVVASPTKRCKSTVVPLAEALGVDVKTSKLLREGRGEKALELVLSTTGDVVFCTHGDVVEDVLRGLRKQGWHVPARPRLAKGSTWVLADERGQYLPPGA